MDDSARQKDARVVGRDRLGAIEQFRGAVELSVGLLEARPAEQRVSSGLRRSRSTAPPVIRCRRRNRSRRRSSLHLLIKPMSASEDKHRAV
jgi:hypothetical protein